MAEERAEKEEATLVERWLKDQQEWQKTMLSYIDSMAKNDDFLVHLGNAMRGSLLAGKPYPVPAAPTAAAAETPADDRIDEILHALRQLEGQVQDLRMSIDELRTSRNEPALLNPVAGSAATKSEASGAGNDE